MISSVSFPFNGFKHYFRILDNLELQAVNEEITYGYNYLILFDNKWYGCYNSIENTRTRFDQADHERVQLNLDDAIRNKHNELYRNDCMGPAIEESFVQTNTTQVSCSLYLEALANPGEFPIGCIDSVSGNQICGHYHANNDIIEFEIEISRIDKRESYYQSEESFVFKHGDEYFLIETTLDLLKSVQCSCSEKLTADQISFDVSHKVKQLALIAATLDI